MADGTLRFDVTSARWEYVDSDLNRWADLREVNSLLQIARSESGRPVGFVFDNEPNDPDYVESLLVIEREFGSEIADRVRSAPETDLEMVTSPVDSLAAKQPEEVEVMRPANRIQAASSEVVIADDTISGVVTVTMTVPWWARFSKPWVAVRRRGKRDILLTGPLRVRGTKARATLRYGMPYSGSSLTADVVKGPRRSRWIVLVSAMLAAIVFLVGLYRVDSSRDNDVVAMQSGDGEIESLMSPSTTAPASAISAITDTVATTTTLSATAVGRAAASTTAPGRGVIEVQPTRECDGRFCALSVEFGRGPGCMQAGDTFKQLGDGFWPEYGLPLVYFIRGAVQPPLPGGPVLRVPVTVVSLIELRGVVPQAAEFPDPPMAGEMVSIVVSNGDYGTSPWASSWFPWCG